MKTRAFAGITILILAAPLLLAIPRATSAGPSLPTAAQLSRLRLGDGFTLVYQVTARDLRTADLRAKEMAEARQATGEALAAGRMPKRMAGYYEVQNEALGKPRPDERFTITLSAREGRLLYLSTRGSKPGKTETRQAILLDAEKEYEVDGKTAAAISNDGWRDAPLYHDENVDRLAFCPLPGVGLPGVDLIQVPVRTGTTPEGHVRFTGLVPRLNLIDGDSPYKAGTLETVLSQGRLRVVSLTVGPPAAPEQAWRIAAYRLVQDHWVGSAMRMTTFEAGTPTSEAEYQLLEARAVALDAAAFGIETYLAKGAAVSDDSTGSSINFAYDPQGGTLKEQAAEARAAKGLAGDKK